MEITQLPLEIIEAIPWIRAGKEAEILVIWIVTDESDHTTHWPDPPLNHTQGVHPRSSDPETKAIQRFVVTQTVIDIHNSRWDLDPSGPPFGREAQD